MRHSNDSIGIRRVVLTGISGYLGRVFLPLLEQDDTIEQIIGIDRRPLSVCHSGKVQFYLKDVQDPSLEDLLQGADALIHLAFVLMRLPGVRPEEIEEQNVRDARVAFETAARQGVRKIIFTSSVVAYGLHPDNPVPLTEESPLCPNEGLYYGRAKAAIERYLDEFEREHSAIVVTRLRPCTVVGPRADPAQMASLVSPTAILVRGANPLYQLIYEDDVAQALYLAVRKNLPGAYNVAGDAPLTLRELAKLRNGRIIALPYFLVRALMGALWRMGRSPFAPEWTDLLRYPLIVSNEKLKQAGWVPRYTTAEALQALLAATKGGSS